MNVGHLKMLVPTMMARVEEESYDSSLWIDTRKIGAFVQVAPVTGQRKVAYVIAAAMFTRQDMLNVECKVGQIDLSE